ncbi:MULTISPECIES: ABC transporter ATP-binding protein [unclassified Oceanispirochaeta]|uniref:ABC transporter ATP-binding protein n=1 Tax=unclassified Oceanispirochaeta TaxID=2635722 RepID=UPI000E09ABF4|nr:MULTISPECIES: ABC transporter ATP-binding protein [unclassified Oceanispirochaeta]MBF9014268.1 ABC transporter ATP-binding protein [Oceanispirochaeta sp. M2]NPD71154.1 ABC transporter ATP-binding protein [Oceanispirochaeta sp. M1]RDG33547.1 ABC transporter ATP-binding protein [Oceanispirochaeta sp. M1]
MINITGVKKTYKAGDTEVKALRGVDLLINKGEFISIAGPSGSGKTTLLNLIGCIDTVDEGEIHIEGQDVTSLKKEEKTTFRRDKLGFIFQSYNLIPVLTAYENVAFSLQLLGLKDKEIKERTMAILKEVGLEGMESRRPAKLSGGQQQRVAVARALIKHPLIVLADEPTANLDSHTGEDILKLMKEMNEKHGTTFVFSTHDKMVMEYADRLVYIHDGEFTSDERRSASESK